MRSTPAYLILAAWLTGAPGHAATGSAGPCQGGALAAYIAKPYAHEQGVRARCALLGLLPGHGATLPPGLRKRLDEELAKRFALDIRFTGSVGLDGDTVDYLMDHMPETAVRVSAYTDRVYRATQIDATPGPGGFFVTDNDTFAAKFTYLASRVAPDESEHVLLERGYAKVFFWRVWGSAIVHYHLDKTRAGAADYDITVHMFTDSRLLRTVLSSGLFKHFADDMFQEILADVEAGVEGFAADDDREAKLPPYFVNGLSATREPGDKAQAPRAQRFRGRPE